jgi:hypothetical protein
MAKFAIIVVDYENHVPRNRACDGILSILNQTYQEYEIFLCHDGPKKNSYIQEFKSYQDEFDFGKFKNKFHFFETTKRMNNWGHSSRDLCMRYAYENSDCDYYIQFNIDNLLERNALELLNNKINETQSKIVIFSIRHHRLIGRGISHAVPFSGLPPHKFNIDCMQLVAHKNIWNEYDFWYDKHEQSDGEIYQKICLENSFVHVADILGDNR